jgi:glutamyl-tRNA reductase
MAMVVVGLNHKTAPVAVREQLAIAEPDLAEPLAQLRHPMLHELVLLSTCNRVEIYMETGDTAACIAACTDFLAAYRGVAPAVFEPHLVYRYDMEAVRHLFRVAASLDSLVVGEPQILGQVKAAYTAARQAGRTSSVFHQLFDRALGVGKAVRHETGINDNAVSVSYAAVELAKKIFESLQQRTAMVLGAGETSELAARHLVRQGVTSIFVANRTHDRAVRLAQALHGKAIAWEHVEEHLAHTDIVVSSTAAPEPIIDKAMVQRVMRARRRQAMFFIDIAVPRDIDPEVNSIENVFLYDIDDLEHVIAANRREREREALVAEEIVWREARQFDLWLEAPEAVPTIVALRQRAERSRQEELEKALAKLGSLDDRPRRALDALTAGSVNKLLHTPTVNLKRSTGQGRLRDDVRLVRHLFDLDS